MVFMHAMQNVWTREVCGGIWNFQSFPSTFNFQHSDFEFQKISDFIWDSIKLYGIPVGVGPLDHR